MTQLPKPLLYHGLVMVQVSSPCVAAWAWIERNPEFVFLAVMLSWAAWGMWRDTRPETQA